jgi:formylglycine-generating enzyme required for sulfatase activity
MAGNVWNWCADLYASDAHAAAAGQGSCCDPLGPAHTVAPGGIAGSERVIKGGSFLCCASYCESYRPTARRGMPSDTGTEHIGFRCVMTPVMWDANRQGRGAR